MTWIALEALLETACPGRLLTDEPGLDHAAWREAVCQLAGALTASGARRVAVYRQDAAACATAVFAAWLAGAEVMLPADLCVETRRRWAACVDLWLTDEDPVPEAGTPCPPRRLDRYHCRLVLCTSGSSGEPKAIVKRLDQLANEVEALERLWGKALGEATIVGSVSAQHIYGLLFRLLWPLCAGRPFVRRQLAFPEDVQQVSRAQRAFAWVASPALLKRMGNNLDWQALSAVKAVFSSGGALPEMAATTLEERLGQPPIEIFGSSETGGIAWRQRSEWWRPFEGVAVSLGNDGALLVASPYLPAGHVEHTSDAAQVRADGHFLLKGRLDRIIKLEEKRVSLGLLEQALINHAWVEDIRFGSVPLSNTTARARLGAVVVLSPLGLEQLRGLGRKAVVGILRNALAQHCEVLVIPRRWRFVHQLPLNPQGKLPQRHIDGLLGEDRPQRLECLAAEQHGDEWHLRLRVPVDLACFSGHFPEAPVLPGVVQVDWALRQGRALMSLPPRFAGMEVLKFQHLVRPGDELRLCLRFDAERHKLYFTYTLGGQPCSSGRILLGAQHA